MWWKSKVRESNVRTDEVLGEDGTKYWCACMWLYKHGNKRDTVGLAWWVWWAWWVWSVGWVWWATGHGGYSGMVGIVGIVSMVGMVGMARQRLISSSKKWWVREDGCHRASEKFWGNWSTALEQLSSDWFCPVIVSLSNEINVCWGGTIAKNTSPSKQINCTKC